MKTSSVTQAIQWLDANLETVMVVILLLGMSFLVGIQVIMRYVFHNSLAWSEELARYMFIWMVYVGISYGVKRNKHISIDVVHNLLPARAAALLSIVADLIFLGFAVLVVMHGSEIVSRVLLSTQNSPALEIPMWMVYSAVPLGFGIVCLRLVQSLAYKTKFFIKKEYAKIP